MSGKHAPRLTEREMTRLALGQSITIRRPGPKVHWEVESRLRSLEMQVKILSAQLSRLIQKGE